MNMKKSEMYHLAMVAVVESESLNSEQMVEIIELLAREKNLYEIIDGEEEKA
jgi:hypothetical protein